MVKDSEMEMEMYSPIAPPRNDNERGGNCLMETVQKMDYIDIANVSTLNFHTPRCFPASSNESAFGLVSKARQKCDF